MSIQSRPMRDALAGAIVSLVAISFYLSSAALIFQGPLSEYRSLGIGAALLGGAVLAVFAAFKGSIGLSSVGPEPATVPILASMSASVASQCTGAAALPTLLVALALAGLCIGITWYLMGRFGAGNVIRYIPYPVIGGFLAGIGWLMFTGGIGVVAGKPFSMQMITGAFSEGPSAQLLLGFGIGLVLWIATQKSKHVLLLPALIVGFSLLIHLALAGMGIGTEEARSQGWLMNAFSNAVPANPLTLKGWSLVDWGVITHLSGTVLSAVIVSIIALLLSDSSLEVAFEERADFNQDLKVLGLGNVIVGLCGGLAGGISISRSLLNKESGAATRWSGGAKALFCALAMFAGGPVIALIPNAVLGGILIYIGIGMLKAWLFDSRQRLTPSDYLAVVIMVCLTVAVGYLPAVVVGIVVCCFDFAISSARLTTVRRSFTRNEWPDKVERSVGQSELLQARGTHVQIVELQGALFFGSVRTLAYDIEKLLTYKQALELLVIDFRRVPWIDSSGAQAMSRVVKLANRHRVRLSFSGVSDAVLKMLRTNGCLSPQGPHLSPDIDHALLDWDDEAIQKGEHSNSPLEDWLTDELGSPGLVLRLLDYLEKIHLSPGDVLFRQGEGADTLYLVQHGRLSAYLTTNQSQYKVRSIQAGGTVGEMGLYRGADRSATVSVDEPSTVLALSRDALHRIEHDDATLAMGLHKLFIRLLASRLDHANAQARALAH